MNEAFNHAAANAESECLKCHGTGSYQYSTRGTPHFTICDRCCKHDKGFWYLQKYYGHNNGKWCCLAGCGFVMDWNPDE